MKTLSTRTLGYLISLTANTLWPSDIRDKLMQSGIYDATGSDTAGLVDDGASSPNDQELLRTPLLDAYEWAKSGNQEAHEALLRFVRLIAGHIAAHSDADKILSELREALLGDGYELRIRGAVVRGGTDRSGRVQLLPIDPDAIPVSTEITALEAELDQRGYMEGREHYRLAIKHFSEQDYPSANSQLRNMVESLVKAIAVDHTDYVDTGRSGQGGAAISTLYTPGGQPPAVIGQRLPENDGGRLLHGAWNILHSNGPHPGLSNADEARIRMQLCTALARFLLKHFPPKQ